MTLPHGSFDARQFPNRSGYSEDAATGLAAAALAFGLLDEGLVDAGSDPVLIRQGRTMGRPSLIEVRFRADGDADTVTGCWLSGQIEADGEPPSEAEA